MKMNRTTFQKLVNLKNLIRDYVEGGGDDLWILSRINEEPKWWAKSDYDNIVYLIDIIIDEDYSSFNDDNDKIRKIFKDLNLLYKAYRRVNTNTSEKDAEYYLQAQLSLDIMQEFESEVIKEFKRIMKEDSNI